MCLFPNGAILIVTRDFNLLFFDESDRGSSSCDTHIMPAVSLDLRDALRATEQELRHALRLHHQQPTGLPPFSFKYLP